ncbi:gamma-glutamyltransferase [Entomomonas asaccharolytica]|uniref:Glutathione hydrolase proenzyme n=1 Tax=Entomomonas asaccharolytica TaxID=2785331 RepID=A0A974RVX6_9GAMM|nr:gamma-glutamyltransferase [Entomomonas asaccharolytica]QQP84575.1 gamma-glutamyltransferase [Entomomonas asaccharolytica]
MPFLLRSFYKVCYAIFIVISINQSVVAEESTVLTAGAVASPNSYGSMAAQQILAKGGNAVDAAVATAFALAVTYPEAGNIGGGGFMTLWVDGKGYFLDYREVAPAKATTDMYLDNTGEVVANLSLYSHKAVAVPGTVAGLWAAHQRFGKLSWQEVLAPAISYAKDGFMVDEQLMQRYREVLDKVPANGNFKEYFGAMRIAQPFKQPELAVVLERIAEQGVNDFYQGETAKLIAKQMADNGGLITESDLNAYQAKWRDPLLANWQGMQVITAPPPSSGGIGLLQLLLMKQALVNDFKGVRPNTARYVHLLAEIEKRVFADRAEYMGDPDFVKVPVQQLLATDYLAKRAKQVNPYAISPTENIAAGLDTEKLQTTHFSIVDKWGNGVANTYTLNGYFGAGIVVKGTGILLNNEMDDFSSKAGVANLFGVVGSEANAIKPNKRPLSSMAPTILTKDNKLVMVIGTPGGSRIFTSIFQVIVNVFEYHMTLQQAVSAPRYHHQLLPKNRIFIERFQHGVPRLVKTRLQQMGYNFHQQDFSGDIQVIQIINDKPSAVADPRGRGRALIVE